MVRQIILVAICSLFLGQIKAQSVQEIKDNREVYIYGEGHGTTVRQADNYALSSIISQISVSVDSNVTSNETETGVNDQLTLESSFEAIVKTYSSATLSNTEMVIIENEPDAHVFRYIRRADIERIFDSRKLKIENMISEAEKALDRLQINDALRYYYWAHTLVKSLRYPNEMFYTDNDGKKQMVNVWIPNCINNVFDKLSVEVKDIDDEKLVVLSLNYDGKPVTSIDYTCFDGLGWSNIYSGKEGFGIIELRKNIEVDNVRIKIEYAFENEAVVDPEVKSVLEVVPSTVYKKAYSTLSLVKITEPEVEQVAISGDSLVEQGSEALVSLDSLSQDSVEAWAYPAYTKIEDIEVYQQIVAKVLGGITSKTEEIDQELFTEKGLQAYNQLITYGSAQIVDDSNPKFYSLGDNVFCRNILMNFSFKHNNRTFMEIVVFEFNSEHKISNVTFGLSRQAANDVFAKDNWPKEARVILTHFLEGYKTAYGLKQLDYIESIFAEDALIITGSYVRSPTAAELSTINNNFVRYTKQSKTEYIRNLKYIFGSTEYININFADSEIMKAGKGGEIYGIQIKQEYHSSSYGDTGYLFLMVDLNDISQPVIHVRTWQPEKDPNFGVYDLAHF